jgi:hypothetical protein
MDITVVENDNVTFRFKEGEAISKVLRDSLSSVFPRDPTDPREYVVPYKDVVLFSKHSLEDIRKRFPLSTYAFLKKLFLDIGKHCLYLEETSGLYISELQLKHIVYIKDKDTFVIIPSGDIISEKSEDSKWKPDLANIVLSFIEIHKLNGTSLYYAILRCQDRTDPIFIYV